VTVEETEGPWVKEGRRAPRDTKKVFSFFVGEAHRENKTKQNKTNPPKNTFFLSEAAKEEYVRRKHFT
jgi:hypothetical protein